MKYVLTGIISLLSAACSQTTTETSQPATQTSATKPLYATSTVRFFSDERRQDTLRVTVNGESILTGEVHLQITDYEGKLLYSTMFPARVLINHEGLINPAQDEQAVKNRIDHFFDSHYFTTPVMASTDSSNTTDPAEMARKNSQTDLTTICFSYQGDQGVLNRIAYSKRLRKVVRVISRY